MKTTLSSVELLREGTLRQEVKTFASVFGVQTDKPHTANVREGKKNMAVLIHSLYAHL